jgi:hypothetical protein
VPYFFKHLVPFLTIYTGCNLDEKKVELRQANDLEKDFSMQSPKEQN